MGESSTEGTPLSGGAPASGASETPRTLPDPAPGAPRRDPASRLGYALRGDLPPQLRRVWPLKRRTVEDIAARDIAVQEAVDEGRLPPPAEPVPLEQPEVLPDPPERFNMAALRLAGLGFGLVLAIGLTMMRLFVGGPPSVDELRAQSGVDSWSELHIGVKDDQFGTAYYDPATKIWSGFDIDVAYMIAEDLGFRRSEVKFYGMESEDRARMQATDVDGNRVPVQLVIASYSITPKRVADKVNFSQSYLYTEQSVMTLAGHRAVASLDDFAGQKVCTLSTSTSLTAPKEAGATVISKNRVRECFAMLNRHEVDAVSTDAAILAGWKARYPGKYDHWDLGLDGTERWGVNVGDNPALKKLVDLTLWRSYADPHDERWEQAFEKNFQTEVPANGKVPIAVAQQPRVIRPDVRELPWEDLLK
ncbi:transporter substrate-binding domain-containing protein [Actinoplanes oblitus]|uniref:Transporter substrate-binding domain-containing protein n=1 Tax=Actinoplanes oblitus TaxID=3040509 RepID=A0ABY8WD38_9ACTN|nr:transporter substrate-binding domain-containing protein [Actinoplanes oblitus]WIM94842.1 transporter substrate-binding domain-containing protein [Actinoplanes oblitus]